MQDRIALTQTWLGLLLVVLGACSASPGTYYPLAEARTWTYQMTVRQGEAADSRLVETKSTVTNLAVRDFQGHLVTPQQSESFARVRWRWIREDRDGIAEVAEQADPGAAPLAREAPNYIIRRPLRVGTSWSSIWQSEQFGQTTLLPTTKEIVSTEEKISVPAGSFESCLKLYITGGGPVTTAAGAEQVSVVGEEWFAPGIGLIRAHFREQVAGRPENTVSVEIALIEAR